MIEKYIYKVIYKYVDYGNGTSSISQGEREILVLSDDTNMTEVSRLSVKALDHKYGGVAENEIDWTIITSIVFSGKVYIGVEKDA